MLNKSQVVKYYESMKKMIKTFNFKSIYWITKLFKNGFIQL